MQTLHEALRAAGVFCFPCWVRYDAARKKWAKGPRVPEGRSWLEHSAYPVDDPANDWSSGVVGVPVPEGLVVFDLDSYKGVTREQVESLLGVQLPWGEAHIQKTIGGGDHYAFRCSWKPRQGDSIDGLSGFDTRAGLKGFICAGAGYTPIAHGGVFAFGNPSVLPELPDSVRPILEHREAQAPAPRSADPIDAADVIQALRHIDPGCSREVWRNIGYSLKAILDDDGFEIFDAWSAGAYWPAGTPANYVPDGKGSVSDQWPTFKAQGGVGAGTLFYHAMRGGWKPPAKFNVTAAFGANAAPADVYAALVEKVRANGSDSVAVPALVDEIRASGCNALQVSLLVAELKSELKGAGIATKELMATLGSMVGREPPPSLTGSGYGKEDSENAKLFLQRHYPDGSLVTCDSKFYAYTGKAWQPVTSNYVRHQVYVDMQSQDSRMAACFRAVSHSVPVMDGQLNQTPAGLVLFQNGVLDLNTGVLHPHDRRLFSTNIMPYAWQPDAQCPQWLEFVLNAFSGDFERVALLQEWFGYMMTTDYRHHKIMVLLGGPRSGKGTIGATMQELVGPENFSASSLSSLASDSHIDNLQTKTVAFMGDVEKRVSGNIVSTVIERLKTISGNDAVNWHRMYHGGMTGRLPTRFTIAGNNVPQLFDDSGALAARMLLLTFDKSYLDREDHTLGARLRSEIEGIAAWAVQGWRRLQAQGRFTNPAAVRDEARLIRESYSPLTRFLAECCEVDRQTVTAVGDIYDAYRAWALKEQEELVKPKVLAASLRDALRGRGVQFTGKEFTGLRVLTNGLSESAFKLRTV